MSSFLKDFRNFIGKGSAIDLAIGLIVGGAIGTIIKSFVDELVIPMTGLLGRVDFSNMYFVLNGSVPEGTPLSEARKITGAVVLGYGQFATIAINTLVLAFAVFLVVRAVNKVRATIEIEEKAATPALPADIALLTEIRDLLKSSPR